MTQTLVIGAGIVGRAATWDLVRRGHRITVADVDETSVGRVAAEMGATAATADVTDAEALGRLIAEHDVVISAVPYRFGLTVAAAAIAAGAHYLDFGGNPTIVAEQRNLDQAARSAGVAVVPTAVSPLGSPTSSPKISSLRRPTRSIPSNFASARSPRCPEVPSGTNWRSARRPHQRVRRAVRSHRERSIQHRRTADQLRRRPRGNDGDPLEASAPQEGRRASALRHAERVQHLEYKTLRFPGHGRIVSLAIREMGLFEQSADRIRRLIHFPKGTVLINALDQTGFRAGEPDLVLGAECGSKRTKPAGYSGD